MSKTTVEKIEIIFDPRISPHGSMAIVYRSGPGQEQEARIYYPSLYSWYRIGVISGVTGKVIERKLSPGITKNL